MTDAKFSQSRMTKDRNAERVNENVKNDLEQGEHPTKEEAK